MGMGVQLDDGQSGSDEGETHESIVAEINITPLTDVFLVLLIVFMVTSSAIVESEALSRTGMKVALPKANASGKVTEKRRDPVLTVTKEGKLYLGTKVVDPANLEAELRKGLQEAGSETLLLRGDKQVMLGAAVDVMTIGRKAGAKTIAILTAQGAGGGEAAK